MPERRWFTLQYLCGHYSSAQLGEPPLPGETRICPKCGRELFVTWSSAEFRIVCLGCVVRQRFGQSMLTLNLFADRHMRRFPTHAMRVMQGNLIVEVRAARRPENILDLELPPF